jgi:hypothetical protein
MARDLLHPIGDVSVAQEADSAEREGRPRQIPAQPLAPEVIVGREADARVEVEALEHDGVGLSRRRWRQGCLCVVVVDVVRSVADGE